MGVLKLFPGGKWFFGEKASVPPQPKTEIPALPLRPIPAIRPANSLHIGKGNSGCEFYVPLNEFGDSGFRFLLVGQSGSGKSYFTGVMLEEFIEMGKRTIIIDPEGEWTTLANHYEGKISILGGAQGIPFKTDVPDPTSEELEAMAKQREKGLAIKLPERINPENYHINPDADDFKGIRKEEQVAVIKKVAEEVIGKILTSKGQSLICDLSEFDDDDQQILYAIIANTLFRMEEERPVSVFLMVDEASIYAPQNESSKPAPGTQSCKKVSAKISRRGRKRGLDQGYALQRPANFDKNVLANCTIRFIGRIEEELDYKALKHLLQPHQITFEHLKQLSTGQFYCIYKGNAQLVHIRKRNTEHGGRTPINN